MKGRRGGRGGVEMYTLDVCASAACAIQQLPRHDIWLRSLDTTDAFERQADNQIKLK